MVSMSLSMVTRFLGHGLDHPNNGPDRTEINITANRTSSQLPSTAFDRAHQGAKSAVTAPAFAPATTDRDCTQLPHLTVSKPI